MVGKVPHKIGDHEQIQRNNERSWFWDRRLCAWDKSWYDWESDHGKGPAVVCQNISYALDSILLNSPYIIFESRYNDCDYFILISYLRQKTWIEIIGEDVIWITTNDDGPVGEIPNDPDRGDREKVRDASQYGGERRDNSRHPFPGPASQPSCNEQVSLLPTILSAAFL